MKETFGEYIHKLRTEGSMTLTKLAAALDLDQSTLSKIENGKRNVPAEILPKLASTFFLDIKELEKEYYSEKIAEIIYSYDEPKNVLKLAEEKAKYFKLKNIKQGEIKF
jgi:transcriptional regulator with XRE-family HTH domain